MNTRDKIMTFSAKILCDSVTENDDRLTTLEVTFPRIVLSEFNTHRMFSRNSASSRAIPVEKMLKLVKENTYIPSHWGKNQKGMSAEFTVEQNEQMKSRDVWLKARDNAISSAENLLKLGIHKQITNRLLEPFMWHTVIVSATDWSNFFALRCHPGAHPDIRQIAEMMKFVINGSEPKPMYEHDWHMPLIDHDDINMTMKMIDEDVYQYDNELLKKISVGRCARVSYLTHDGKRDHNADINLHDKLLSDGHMSPFEHIARPMYNDEYKKSKYSGNFRGWVQYRKTLIGECK